MNIDRKLLKKIIQEQVNVKLAEADQVGGAQANPQAVASTTQTSQPAQTPKPGVDMAANANSKKFLTDFIAILSDPTAIAELKTLLNKDLTGK